MIHDGLVSAHLYLCADDSIVHSNMINNNYFFSSLQQSTDNAYMAVPCSRVNRPGTTFVRHVQIHALLEEHSGTFRVSVQRCYVHQCGPVFRSFEDACFEFIGQ